mmetsp:Transcript_15589/g.33767  ORF Transcript_15589/g.33767 Transcript_15589/m.33767 type:complete len:204 (-) Transcript_15589:931-1542(-)
MWVIMCISTLHTRVIFVVIQSKNSMQCHQRRFDHAIPAPIHSNPILIRYYSYILFLSKPIHFFGIFHKPLVRGIGLLLPIHMNNILGNLRHIHTLHQSNRRLGLIMRQNNIDQLQLVHILQIRSLRHLLLRRLVHPILNILNLDTLGQILPIAIARNGFAGVGIVKVLEGELGLFRQAIDEEGHVFCDFGSAFVGSGGFVHAG